MEHKPTTPKIPMSDWPEEARRRCENLDRCPKCGSWLQWERMQAHEQCGACGYVSNCCCPDNVALPTYSPDES